MTLSLVDSDSFSEMERVADLMFELQSETKVAKELGIPRKQVMALHSQYKEILLSDSEAKDMARDHLHGMVKHYDKLIAAYYELLGDLRDLKFHHLVAAQIGSSLKGIADLEKQRLDALQKAGLLEQGDLGDDLAEREKREAMLIDILRNDLCDVCRATVARKLTEITNTVEAEVIYDDIVDGQIV